MTFTFEDARSILTGLPAAEPVDLARYRDCVKPAPKPTLAEACHDPAAARAIAQLAAAETHIEAQHTADALDARELRKTAMREARAAIAGAINRLQWLGESFAKSTPGYDFAARGILELQTAQRRLDAHARLAAELDGPGVDGGAA